MGGGASNHTMGGNVTMPKMNMTMQKAPTKNFTNALDDINIMKYDMLVQACLATGAKCIIDIHNYARFNDLIIGQGGPTNEQFADLWTQIATMVSNSELLDFLKLTFPSTKPSPMLSLES